MLIEAGADVNADNDLALVTASANPTIMELLIAHGARVNPYPNAPCSPLVFGCEIQSPTLVHFLLSKGADPNACVYSEFRPGNPNNPEQGGKNPALWLTKSKRQISPLLVALGTPFGNWPRKKRSDWYFLAEIVEALISAGADLSAKRTMLINDEGMELTPLGYALKHEDAENVASYQKAIEILRQHGATE